MRIQYLAMITIIMAGILTTSTGATDTIIDLPPEGTDVSNVRCQGRIISTGDTLRQVREKCPNPLNEGPLVNRNYYILVYRFENSNAVHYLAFRNRALERIYRVNCLKDDPHCQ